MAELIGITEERLRSLIEEAMMRGYEMARKDAEEGDWLHGQAQIIAFLSDGGKKMSDRTFQRHRSEGMYGEAITGSGYHAVARKGDLLQAIRMYRMRQY